MLLRATHDVGVLDIAALPIRMSIAHHGDQRRRSHSGIPHLEELTNSAANLHLQALHAHLRLPLKMVALSFCKAPDPMPSPTCAW